jgi:two-component system, response regulator, stage 0 sporulation protein F
MPHSQPAPALLIVDDTPSIRQVFTHLLHDAAPYEVVAVGDAAAALALLAERPIPLVITDYHLPDLDGAQLAAAVKARSPDTKIVLITADIDVENMSLGPDVDVCLIKPFPLRDLATVVRDMLPGF